MIPIDFLDAESDEYLDSLGVGEVQGQLLVETVADLVGPFNVHRIYLRMNVAVFFV